MLVNVELSRCAGQNYQAIETKIVDLTQHSFSVSKAGVASEPPHIAREATLSYQPKKPRLDTKRCRKGTTRCTSRHPFLNLRADAEVFSVSPTRETAVIKLSHTEHFSFSCLRYKNTNID